jgi:hypothetical protein
MKTTNKIVISSSEGNSSTLKYNLQDKIVGLWSLDKFMTTNCFYNVNSYNNVLSVETQPSNPGAINVTLISGYYTAYELASHVQTLLNAAFNPIVFTVTYDSNTGKFSITNESAETINIFPNVDNSCYLLLGLGTSNLSGVTINCPNIADLQTVKFFYIDIKENTNRNFESKGFIRKTFLIPNESIFTEKFTYKPNDEEIQEIQEIQIDSPVRDLTIRF